MSFSPHNPAKNVLEQFYSIGVAASKQNATVNTVELHSYVLEKKITLEPPYRPGKHKSEATKRFHKLNCSSHLHNVKRGTAWCAKADRADGRVVVFTA